MYFTLRRPCSDCPFLRENGIRLRPGRVKEIAGGMLHEGGGITFACHNTVLWEDQDSPWAPSGEEQHCAGALLFAEGQGVSTQAMQIAERLGLYDPAVLTADPAIQALVFSSIEEMLSTAF